MELTQRQKRLTLITMILASGIVFLDGTVINVALPAIDKDLNAGLSGLQWIVDSYVLTLSAFLILGGSLGDQYGRKRVMLGGLLGFGIASLGCGLAPTTGWLIFARLLQGLAGAFLVPGSLAILTAIYSDPQERGQAIGQWAGWSGISTIIGPTVGGWLVDNFSWRWVFLINIPILIVTAWLLATQVPENRDDEAVKSLDWAGALLIVIGLGGTIFALIEAPVLGWTDPLILVAFGFGIVALIGFFVVEARLAHPMLPLSLFQSRNFSGVNLATFLIYSALYASSFFFTLFIQNVVGLSAFLSGAIMLPTTFMLLFFSPVAGRLAGRYGARIFMTIGPLIYGASLLLAATWRPDSSVWLHIMPTILLMGVGLMFTVAPLTSVVMNSVPSHNAGTASAVNNVVSRIAALLSIAGLGVVSALAFRQSTANPPAELAQQFQSLPATVRQNPFSALPEGTSQQLVSYMQNAQTGAFVVAIIASAALTIAGGLVSFALIRDKK
jgi:EmrB/QacA subfamily drug resistance transporter